MSQTITNIETTSNLIKACRAIGATYHEDKIVFADKRTAPLTRSQYYYQLTIGPGRSLLLPATGRVIDLQVLLLESHIKILQEKA
jgi:hypothetical protein